MLSGPCAFPHFSWEMAAESSLGENGDDICPSKPDAFHSFVVSCFSVGVILVCIFEVSIGEELLSDGISSDSTVLGVSASASKTVEDLTQDLNVYLGGL